MLLRMWREHKQRVADFQEQRRKDEEKRLADAELTARQMKRHGCWRRVTEKNWDKVPVCPKRAPDGSCLVCDPFDALRHKIPEDASDQTPAKSI